jgi:enhancing lycopene biosynthesis protein 2
MKTVGVVLSGCGFLDGAEIYESTLTLLFLDRAGVRYQCLAPDIPQMHVINHAAQQPTPESRNVLIEAARIARGAIAPLDESWVDKLDAVIFAGGYGAAKNLCDFAVKGRDCTVHPIVESFVKKVVAAGKPLGMLCISPVVLARTFKGSDLHPTITVGAASPTSEAVETWGAKHVVCPSTDDVVDRDHKIVTSPAYMYDTRIADAAQGIEKLVKDVISLMNQ